MTRNSLTKRRLRHDAMKRPGAVVSAFLLGTALLTGCSSVDKPKTASGSSGGGDGVTAVDTTATDAAIRKIAEGKTIKVGYSPPILSEFYTQIEKSAFVTMKNYEDRFGIKWQWERQGALNDAHSGTEATGIVQGFIARNFDAVFVCSAAPASAMQELYAQGSEKGINFFQFNSTEELANPSQATDPTGGLNTVSNIGYDDRWQSGYVAGKYIAEKLKGEGKIIAILGPSGSDWTKLRSQGFDKAISEYPGLQVVGRADGGYVRDKGLAAAQDLLTKNRDVSAIWGENEDMALGASQAIDALGLKHWDGQEGIITLGADGLVSGMESIRAGKLTATIDVNSVEMGRMMIETLFAHEILGQNVAQFIRIPTGVVDKSNVDWHEARIKDTLAAPGKY